MVWHSDCHLIDNSRLKKIIEKGSVVGFTLSNGSDTREIKINDSFLCLEELPSCNKESKVIYFVGLIFVPSMCSYFFYNAEANLAFMDFRIRDLVINSKTSSLVINPFVEPKRILSYTYVVYDKSDVKNVSSIGDLCLFNIDNKITIHLEKNIKQIFSSTALKVFSVKIISLKDYKYKLEVSLGTEKNNNPSDIIYFDLKIISDTDTLYYEIANIFTYRGNNYSLVQNKPKDQCYLGEEFFKRFIKSNFMYDLVRQETEHKRRTRELG